MQSNYRMIQPQKPLHNQKDTSKNVWIVWWEVEEGGSQPGPAINIQPINRGSEAWFVAQKT